jgi:hypothetical protein
MKENIVPKEQVEAPSAQHQAYHLTMNQISMIEEAIESLGEYGELRLVLEKGRLRFIVTHKSFDALKYTPGMINGKSR